jgi:hypothetical protein
MPYGSCRGSESVFGLPYSVLNLSYLLCVVGSRIVDWFVVYESVAGGSFNTYCKD